MWAKLGVSLVIVVIKTRNCGKYQNFGYFHHFYPSFAKCTVLKFHTHYFMTMCLPLILISQSCKLYIFCKSRKKYSQKSRNCLRFPIWWSFLGETGPNLAFRSAIFHLCRDKTEFCEEKWLFSFLVNCHFHCLIVVLNRVFFCEN
jgi:hypothetical protein